MADSRKMLNLPVLKRHDASITDIVDQFSYAALYKWNGSSWTKDTIQGTLFLFRRSGHPRYGFFILNRHGLKNFAEDITAETSVQFEDGIVIVSCASDDPNEADKTYGLWCSEPDERDTLNSRLLELTEASAKALRKSQASSAGSTSATNAMPISLDALFGAPQHHQQHQQQHSMAHPAPRTDVTTSSHTNDQQGSAKGLDLLDSIFNSAQPQTNGTSSSAAPTPPSVHQLPQQTLAASQRRGGPPSNQGQSQQVDDAAALMAMIGLAPSSGAQQPHQQQQQTQQQHRNVRHNPHQESSGSSTMKAAAYTPGPPPAVPQETRPQQQQQQQQSLQGNAMRPAPTTNGVSVLPRGLDRQTFPGELVKTLFAEPKLADALYSMYQSGQF